MNNPTYHYETIVVGSGLAGMATALRLATHHRVALIFENDHMSGATPWAQGGLSAVAEADDSFELHAKDTLQASANQGLANVIDYFVEQCPQEIAWLIELGIPFTKTTDQQYNLHREGGHSARRIYHTHDHTGLTLAQHFSRLISNHPQIDCFDKQVAMQLINHEGRVYGIQTWHQHSKQVHNFVANQTVLATGGAVGLYPLSTCPQPSYGAGIAMASKAGAEITNMEFTQFHPTRFYHPDSPPFLISEALRGEGALLIDTAGKRFMPSFHPDAELAPRDVVSRAIYQTIQQQQENYVYLDIRQRSAAELQQAFPRIAEHCAKFDILLHRDLIPVSPAAHYTCGGINVNRCGQTSVAGLYALGETANTGIHGANRLASNSLSECLVFSKAAVENIVSSERHSETKRDHIPRMPSAFQTCSSLLAEESIQSVQSIMHQYFGIARDKSLMESAHQQLKTLKNATRQHTSQVNLNKVGIQLEHMLTCADLIAQHASFRQHSCGAHYLID